jgi:Uncharacterized protein conserved in bacteria (DUF2059)
MRISGMMVMMFFFTAGLASATTVDLANGNAVQGDIVNRDSKSIQINVDGVTMTYYADEIKDIDGKPFAPAPAAQPDTIGTGPQEVAQPEAAAPAPAAQPEAAAGAGSIDPDKKALIMKFIDVFGTRQALTNNFNMMLKQIEKDKPDEAQKIRQRVKIDEIIERLLPIYDRNFSTDDLNAFIAFYGSPEGQKLIGTIPELMKESVQESIKYMEEKFPEVKQGQ